MPQITDGSHTPDFQPAIQPVPWLHANNQMVEAVAARNGSMVNSYREKYHMDSETGQLVPITNSANAHPLAVEFVQEGDKQVAYLKGLAAGTVVPYGSSFEYDNSEDPWDNYALTYANQFFDGKQHIRRAVWYWKRDPLVYKCIKFLTQTANSPILVESDNDDFRDLVEIWLESAMPHSFKEQWYREYFRSGYVVALKCLIPYVPREYKYGKIPQPQGSHVKAVGADGATMGELEEGDDISPMTEAQAKAARERAEVHANASVAKANELVATAAADKARYMTEASRLKDYKVAHAQGLCSGERLRAQAAIVIKHQYKWLKGMVPAAYTLLDPLAVDLYGPLEMSMLREPYLIVGAQLRMAVSDPTPQQADVVATLPHEIVEQIKDGATRIWLSPNICNITNVDKQDYERYPTPMMRHCFDALEMKQSLMAADKLTLATIKNRILKVTIGSDLHPVYNDEPLRKLAATFATRAQSFTIFWNHTLQVEWVEPPLNGFMDPEKYELWDDQIRMVWGIVRMFTGNVDTAGAVGPLNLTALVQEVNSAQAAYLEFANSEVALLKTALGVGAQVRLSYPQLNLEDRLKFITVLQGMVQNGLIDPRTALETLNYHFPTIVKRMEETKKLRAKGLFVPTPSANNLGPDGGILPSGGAGGKPAKAPMADNNKNKKGKPQPKTKAKGMFVSVEGGEGMRFVIDADQIEDDARLELSASFGITPDWILSRAEYQAAYGKALKFVPALPALSLAETLSLAREVTKATGKVMAAADQAVADLKAANKGKRGPWMSDKMRQATRYKAIVASLDDFGLGDGVSAEELSAWQQQVKEELATNEAEAQIEQHSPAGPEELDKHGEPILPDGIPPWKDEPGDWVENEQGVMELVTSKLVLKSRYKKLKKTDEVNAKPGGATQVVNYPMTSEKLPSSVEQKVRDTPQPGPKMTS